MHGHLAGWSQSGGWVASVGRRAAEGATSN